MTDFIDDIMGFDPQDLNVFNEPTKVNYDQNVYKTNPANSKSEDGRYRSKIKVLYNPFSVKDSIVKQCTYAMTDGDGFFMVKSKLASGDKTCPIFNSWKKLWFSGDDSKKNWAKQMYEKSESQWVLVQILEDENQPELVGQFKAMKLPKVIYEKMEAKMKPSPESKKSPVPITDYLIGLVLEMDVQPGPDDPANPSRKQREISYSLCDFGEYSPIIKTDGTQLFTDEELETIDNFATAKENIGKAKTEAKKQTAEKAYAELVPSIKQLYAKAIEYMKENAIDIVEECAYKEWDEKTTNRVNNWIAAVSQMQDPKTYTPSSTQAPTATVEETSTSTEDAVNDMMGEDLPF